tara:strand:+ start:423 stop:809 length:387 start_codon:yes stop_codon:yes gene_type:complete
MLVMGFLIVKNLLASHNFVKGYVEKIDCHEDVKIEGTYSYHILTSNNESFKNRLDIPCDSISQIEIGDYIEIESQGHIFVQVTHEEVDIFDRNLLNIKRSGVNITFVLLFILATGDLIYRLYFSKKKK